RHEAAPVERQRSTRTSLTALQSRDAGSRKTEPTESICSVAPRARLAGWRLRRSCSGFGFRLLAGRDVRVPRDRLRAGLDTRGRSFTPAFMAGVHDSVANCFASIAFRPPIRADATR